MPQAVALPQQKASLTRTLRVGDELSFDNGRIVIRIADVNGRRAKVNCQLDRDTQVDKPPKKTPS